MTLLLSGVSKAYGTTEVLHDVSLAVPDGTRLALVGSSGSGKSTLLRIIAGFETPDVGVVLLDGRELVQPGSAVPAHRRGIGYVAQDGALFPHLSVARNIAFGLPRAADRRSRVEALMEIVSLTPDLADRMPHELSGGQQQRVALARALALDPRVILLDEPFSALDTGLRAHTREAVIDVLDRRGVTAVLVTHDQDEALSFGQQVGVLSDGALVQSGEPAAVFDAPVNPDVAAFLGDVLFVPGRRTTVGTVECVFGDLEVRHDLSVGADAVRVMVRPAQLQVSPAAEDDNASVVGIRAAGAASELTLGLDRGEVATPVRYRVPSHEAHRFPVGTRVHAQIQGGAVIYPSDDLAALAMGDAR